MFLVSLGPEVDWYSLKPTNIYIVVSAFSVFATVAILLRCYVRAHILKSFGLDDWLLLLCFLIYICNNIIFMIIGHMQTPGVNPPFSIFVNLTIAGYILYITDQVVLKLALAAFFLRIARERWQRITILLSTLLHANFSPIYLFVTLFQCGSPLGLFTHPASHCLNWHHTIALSYVYTALNATTDWIFALAPILVVLRTHMPFRQKVGVCALIALASLGSIVSVIRIGFVKGGVEGAELVHLDLLMQILSVLETGTGILCLSFAVLKPLFARRRRAMGVACVCCSLEQVVEEEEEEEEEDGPSQHGRVGCSTCGSGRKEMGQSCEFASDVGSEASSPMETGEQRVGVGGSLDAESLDSGDVHASSSASFSSSEQQRRDSALRLDL